MAEMVIRGQTVGTWAGVGGGGSSSEGDRAVGTSGFEF
jgi:hypothetical protein